MLVECSSCSPVFIAIPPITGRSVSRVLHLWPATPLLVVGGPRLHTPCRSSSWPRSPSRIERRALSGSHHLQVHGVSAPAVCSVPRRPGVYSALDFQTTGLRTLHRHVHAAAPRLPLSMAVGVAAPSPFPFEVLCCRSRLRVGELCYFSYAGPVSPHGRHLGFLELQSSIVFSSFLPGRGCCYCSGFCSGSADVEIAFD
ncbi:hypothetical protein NDU88_003029 [Pleurodeles waltl]|uniref:Uncharacterized protein n=1 Tax=Pleurodeles waltl TaxID=8319 RepID=A0AAV7L513_PLEWA|nr:hypothetical protein NDU88_003029 [Pleurodeles waltl]